MGDSGGILIIFLVFYALAQLIIEDSITVPVTATTPINGIVISC